MAKKSKVVKEMKRQSMVEQYKTLRAEMKANGDYE